MKTLYLECAMGAAGNMLTAALLELVNDKADFLKQINSIGIPGLKMDMESVVKCGISGTHIRVSINGTEESCTNADILKYSHKNLHTHFHKHIHNNISHKHSPTSFEKIENIIARLSVSQKVKDNALSIYRLIAGAEASAHGTTSVEQIHFHELGNSDAIADIVGVCMLMESLAPQETIASPINVGSGFVQCAHGLMPVPSPATAHILQDIPIYSRNAHEELCTPTGAATIKHFAKRFEHMPKMRVQKIGYGMGTKDFESVNCLRTFLGETDSNDEINDCIAQLQCNLDDMTGEAIGFAVNLLLQKGALDVFTVPIQMKKNRPAVLLTCICSECKAHFFAELILRHTTTFGIRRTTCDRYALKRKILTKQTLFGNIRIKIGEGYNIKKFKPEYDDIAEAAHLNNVSFGEVNDTVLCNKTNKEKKI